MTSADLKKKLLRRIANLLTIKPAANPGLCSGKTGYAMFFYLYASYAGNPAFARTADMLIDDVLKELNTNLTHDLQDGLAGIAVGIGYLISHGMIETDDPDVMLADMDKAMLDGITAHGKAVKPSPRFYAPGHYVISRTAGQAMTARKMQITLKSLGELKRVFSAQAQTTFPDFEYAASALLYLNYLIDRNILREKASAVSDSIISKLTALHGKGIMTNKGREAIGLAGRHPVSKQTRLDSLVRQLRPGTGATLTLHDARHAPQLAASDNREQPLPDYWQRIIFSSFEYTAKELRAVATLFGDPSGKAYKDTSFLLGLGLWLLKADLSSIEPNDKHD